MKYVIWAEMYGRSFRKWKCWPWQCQWYGDSEHGKYLHRLQQDFFVYLGQIMVEFKAQKHKIVIYIRNRFVAFEVKTEKAVTTKLCQGL